MTGLQRDQLPVDQSVGMVSEAFGADEARSKLMIALERDLSGVVTAP